MKKTILASAAFTMLSVWSAWADCLPGVNCNQPTAVTRGQAVPVWAVLYCFRGPADGQHEIVDCQDPQAVHIAPSGNEAVCFMGSDGKPHWDYQWAVYEGRRFINRRVNGQWQPDWQ
jgi:hypothetical protein